MLPYTTEHKRFRERLHDFCRREVIPYVDEWERNHLIPRNVWKKMGREGFLCTAVSPEYGGMGGDFLYSVIALEEVSRTNHYGLDAFLHSDIVVPYIVSYGNEDQKRRYLPGCVNGDIVTAVAMSEPSAGSDLASMQTTAVEDGDEVIINGSKTFISNGVSCDLVVLAARAPEIKKAHDAISLYLVEGAMPGVQKGNSFVKMGCHSQDTADLYFTNCRMPKSNRLGEKGSGFSMLMAKLQQERLLVALLSQTKAEFIVEWIIEHLKGNGMIDPRSQNAQSVNFALAEMVAEVKIGRTFVDSLILAHMRGASTAMDTSIAKYWMSETANRVAQKSLDLLGDYGETESCPIVRTFRDLRVTTIFAGTNEIMKMIIAKSITA